MSKYGESLKFYLVDVKDIESDFARSTFDEQELEELADLILATGSLLQPLVLKQTGPMTYKVLEGHRQFYAAVKAKEKEPILAEMVSAFVVQPEIEATAVEQAKVLNKTLSTPIAKTENVSTSDNTLERRVNNQETRLDNGLREVKTSQKQDTQRLEEQIKQLQLQIPKRLEPLEALNTLDVDKLMFALKTVGMAEKRVQETAKKIEKERKKSAFTDLQDVIKRKVGITANTMIKIVDTCSKLGFFF
jgi:ParB-like chromosome segregation protein Spo0J